MRVFHERPETALAVYAHPGDAEVAAGGVLASWAAAGASVHLVVVCDGAKGTHVTSSAPTQLRSQRHEELRDAAAILGVARCTELDWPDGAVENSDELRGVLVGLIREWRPDIVVGPDPTAVFFGGVYVNHRDHRETGWALLDAVAPAAAMPLYYPERGEAHQVRSLLLSGTHEPDVVVDVEETIDVKARAVLRHSSQVDGDDAGVAAVVRERAAQAGRPVGLASAEAFRCVDFNL